MLFNLHFGESKVTYNTLQQSFQFDAIVWNVSQWIEEKPKPKHIFNFHILRLMILCVLCAKHHRKKVKRTHTNSHTHIHNVCLIESVSDVRMITIIWRHLFNFFKYRIFHIVCGRRYFLRFVAVKDLISCRYCCVVTMTHLVSSKLILYYYYYYALYVQ